MNATIGGALRAAVRCLEQHGVSEPRASAEVLLADVLALTRSHLYLEAHALLSTPQRDSYAARIKRRLHGEPVQYITGRQEFWSLDFEVNPQVLIPRPESELLVEHGIRLTQQWCSTYQQPSPSLLDVGTGSGNLAISLAHSMPQSQVWGVDIAVGALHLARRNAHRSGIASRLIWICGDLVAPLQERSRHFALCVSNLPYVTTAEWHRLPREIRDYEPPEALVGGNDGLDVIQRLVVAIPKMLAPGGTLLLEVGRGQARAITEIIWQCHQFQEVGVYQDFASIDRVVWAQLP